MNAANQNAIVAHAGIVRIGDSGGQERTSQKFFMHPNYNNRQFWATPDIALIKVAEPFNFNENLNKISLYPTNLDENRAGKASGWGFLNKAKTELPNDLFYVDTKILSNAECKNKYRPLHMEAFITQNKACTFKEVGKGFCQGDSGGGLEVTEGSTRYLIGVLSYNANGCANGSPEVFEKAFQHIDWIRKILSDNL